MADKDYFEEEFMKAELQRLNSLAATTTDTCTVAKNIAFSDHLVRKLINQKRSNGFEFQGVHCKYHSAELVYVVFHFSCPPNRICLVDPTFAVVVNLFRRAVEGEPIDPYISRQAREYSPQFLGERTELYFENLSGRDIHIKAEGGDVHTGSWGPEQLNHHAPEKHVKSRKINFGSKANFPFTVWKNDAGRLGSKLGDYTHGVRYNAAGRWDRLEFVGTTINGEEYMEVISVKAAARVALWIWAGV